MASSRPLYSQEQKDLYKHVSQNAPIPSIKRVITPARRSEDGGMSAKNNPAMSFVMLNESQIVPSPSQQTARPSTPDDKDNRVRSSSHRRIAPDEENLLSHKIETTARLFEILSSQSDIDHPICVDCTDLLIEGMEKRLANATKERDAYVEFLKDAHADVPTNEERLQAQQELKSIKEQEATALAELEQLEAEKAALEEEIALLDREAHELDNEEEAFWRDRNAFAQILSDSQNEKDSLNQRNTHDNRRLEQLQRTNVYNDTFSISHNGPFGTINNLRLGRLHTITVEWTEINAAWGQACLLLATIADKLNFTFQGYRLNPMGSTSTIDRITSTPLNASTRDTSASIKSITTSLSLYHYSDLPLGISFLNRSFDTAMIAFLECVSQLGKHVEQTTQGTEVGGEFGLTLPYEIKKDQIADVSIKMPSSWGGGGAEEAWTRACKFTLTSCKFLLAHASNVGGGGRGR